MIFLLKLVTKPGQRLGGHADIYYVAQKADAYMLHHHGFAPQRFASLEKLAHTLGGVVPWDRWSDEAQHQLDHLNLRGAF